ncbi:MAG TPA: NAD(P)-binding domain-containing protein [Euzebyales bacterium]
MRIAVLGTGPVGQAIAGKLAELGHDVTVGTRSVATAMARTEPDTFGNPAFPTWVAQHPEVGVATLADAAAAGELVVNATNGGGSIAALEAAGEERLTGKVLIDIANPLDFSAGMPPSLWVSNTDSLAEQIQRRLPETRVVKALNTINAYVMVDPKQLAGGDHTVFVSGNDPAAKTQVTELLRSLGWSDVIDLGDITTARGTEMYLPLWARLWAATQNPMFNIKVVR